MASHQSDTDSAMLAGKDRMYEVLPVKDYEHPGYAVLCWGTTRLPALAGLRQPGR